MIRMGMTQTLEVIELSEVGVYLAEVGGDKSDKVLLPNNQTPKGVEIGEEFDVFIYRDSEDRVIATREKPLCEVGEIAISKVVSNTEIGTFMNWGLAKDLLVPFAEQRFEMEEGKEYLISPYIDKSGRIAATTDVYRFLEENHNFDIEDSVTGTIYKIVEGVGIFFAIENKYRGFISENHFHGKTEVGKSISGRVIGYGEDGELTVSPQKILSLQMDDDSEKIVNKLKEKGGFFKVHDKSSPEEIKEELNMSKKAFKRAVGKLYRERVIKITDTGLELIKK